ncbi:MAG: hypothetical protein K9N35_05925 [Candidatus Marinimicrobia bacterium]|nr:hypothetical protein [Candidatus Neomarinimicrobiota bacterium]
MIHINKAGLIAFLIGGLLIGCEETKDDPSEGIPLPLAGTYTLTEMTITTEATTLRDTSLTFIATQNGLSFVTIDAGTLILTTSAHYTDQDATPVGGTVDLNNDSTATLAGLLPVNWGTGCQPLILISQLASDGKWAADTTTSTFSIDLVIDQLDINGTYSLLGDQLEIRYTALETADERMISTVTYLGNDTAVIPACLPVSTVTERIMKLTLN